MPLIRIDKPYESLVTFGCSFTGGHDLGPNGAWGHFLANRLGCKHINKAGGASNTNILTGVINFCENNDMSNICVGIQWSEVTRREIWNETFGGYDAFGLGTLLNKRPNQPTKLDFIRDNMTFFTDIWFDLRENTLRTVLAMIQAKSYLEYNNIDFVMFEGINSIKNRIEVDVTEYNLSQVHDLALLNKNKIFSILNDETFFSELGDLNTAMRNHTAFDPTLNDGHPHPEILEWWTDHLYKFLENGTHEL